MDIVSIGEPLMELSSIVKDGQNLYLPGYGGDTSNFLIAAARQGVKTAYFTHVGDDTFGRDFMSLWQKENVDTSCVTLSKTAHTGMYFISYTENGHEFTYMRKGSASSLVAPEDIPEDLIKKAKLLHISGISQAISTNCCDMIFKAAQIAKENGVIVTYDPNLRVKLWSVERAAAIINATIPLCDVFMPSYDDATVLTGLSDADEIIAYYHGLGAKVVVLKMGKEGVIISDGKSKENIKGFVVKTVDQTGAGDTFDGAFCAKYVAGNSLGDCAKYANAAAALSTRGHGAVAPIPVAKEVEEFLKQN